MYSIKKISLVGRNVHNCDLTSLDGFLMTTKNKMFKINGCAIDKIVIFNTSLAHSIVSEKVLRKYNRLISKLTELLLDDDDSGDTLREILNQIEKFRLEIKIKYRKFLKQKELEMMSKKLVVIQKEANKRLIEIHNSCLDKANHNIR